MSTTPSLTMRNGVLIPQIGLGTWEANDPEELKAALRTAFDAGYRHIDTAYFYGNEATIGELIEEYTTAKKLSRAEIFITTKLPPFFHRPADARACIENQLKALRTNYIDLYLIHLPTATKADPDTQFQMIEDDGQWIRDDVAHIDTWRVLEDFYFQGKLRAIGISNFNERQIRDLFRQATVKPMNHQIEVNILCPQNELVKYSKRMGMSVTGYACIGSPGQGNCLTHPVVTRLAEKHKRTTAQILLRYVLERGIVAIIKSTNPGRIRSNFQVFDFELGADGMAALEAIKDRCRLFPFTFVVDHPEHPFDDVKVYVFLSFLGGR
ncbi:oxidoreductasealdo/keto reductase family protein [Aphelenchoides avenae]|nr:oxidoreductasealdo/keto reductase family protein [Aphelenchus avenae]